MVDPWLNIDHTLRKILPCPSEQFSILHRLRTVHKFYDPLNLLALLIQEEQNRVIAFKLPLHLCIFDLILEEGAAFCPNCHLVALLEDLDGFDRETGEESRKSGHMFCDVSIGVRWVA